MANVTNKSPLVIDTADSTITAASLKIAGVRWVGATAAAHVALLTNTAGDTVWTAKAAAANDQIESAVPFRSLGLKVTTLGSGTLYVYLASPENR